MTKRLINSRDFPVKELSQWLEPYWRRHGYSIEPTIVYKHFHGPDSSGSNSVVRVRVYREKRDG